MRGGHLDRQPDPRTAWIAAVQTAFRISPYSVTAVEAEELAALLWRIADRIRADQEQR